MSEDPQPAPANQDPTGEPPEPNFPLTGEVLRAENQQMLQDTIWAPQEQRQARLAKFRELWPTNWRQTGGVGAGRYFAPNPADSPFSKYSSRGWKIHIAYQKGQEEVVAGYLYSSGLYFKAEAGMGTYFNGLHESGATIYIGSKDAMSAIASSLEPLRSILTEGAYAEYSDGRRISIGSGVDIEIAPKITARFDVAKTSLGWYQSNGQYKYLEDGFPPWQGGNGLPLLKEDTEVVREINQKYPKIGQMSPAERQEFGQTLWQVNNRAEQELIKDFGEDFVLGTGSNRKVGT